MSCILPYQERKEHRAQLSHKSPSRSAFSPSCPCCSVAKSCPTLGDPMDCSMPGFPVLHVYWSLLKLMSIESVMPSNHLVLCHPLLLLPSVFPIIRVFSYEVALCIMC